MVMELHVSQLPASPQTCNDYLKAQAEDSVCKTVIEHCKTGWPDRKEEISPELKPYWKAQGELTANKHGLLLFQKRFVVPKNTPEEDTGENPCRTPRNTEMQTPS